MWRKILTVVAVILLVAGLGFLLFPPISNFIGKQKAEASADSFDKTASSVVEPVKTGDGSVIESAEDAVEYYRAAEAARKSGASEEGYSGDGYSYGGYTSDGVFYVYYYDDDGTEYSYYVDDDDRVIDAETDEPVIFQKDITDLYNDSLAYNKMLLTGQGTAETIQFDREAFDVTDYNVYDYSFGYVTADSIGMRLPIFLGASDSIMSYGAGHLYGTSLPINSESENCALAGHTDYIGRIFFDNIRSLDIGDTVTVTNYWDTIDYKVIDYKVVSPDDFSDLVIQSGRQLLTLITCIYDGDGGFDRYLVICEHKK